MKKRMDATKTKNFMLRRRVIIMNVNGVLFYPLAFRWGKITFSVCLLLRRKCSLYHFPTH